MEGEGGPRVSRLKYRKTITGSCTSADVLKRSPAVPWPCRSRWSDQVPSLSGCSAVLLPVHLQGHSHILTASGISKKNDDLWTNHSWSQRSASGLLRNRFYINDSGYMIILQAGYFPQLPSAHTGSVFVSHHESRCVQASTAVHQRADVLVITSP